MDEERNENDLMKELPLEEGIITKIERQKRAKDRYNLYIEEQYVFSVHEDVLIKYSLTKGTAINKDEMKKIVEAQDKQQAYLDAIRLLSFRLRSEYELKARLLQKGYELPTIENTLDRLRREQYIDDSLFAEQLTQQRIQSAKKGRNWIKQELQQKGLKSEHITSAIEQIDEQIEYRNAYDLINKKYGSSLKPDSDVQNIKRKAYALLQRRGYNSRVTTRVVRELTDAANRGIDSEDWEIHFEE
ncbi:regulatory protein [Paenibacillus sp. 1_12]|uniref:RecX family transcriptional regulator n=1 Tax=Paenibacillus sp. 1_12 TaxID=1566278 RepID=UPI0008E77EB4|nr:RecX family transcriptional regulator [Paenibacillus sp. 1_12]SFL44759.1 regulatory protein [Paenibacillus sp. 1_12]